MGADDEIREVPAAAVARKQPYLIAIELATLPDVECDLVDRAYIDLNSAAVNDHAELDRVGR